MNMHTNALIHTRGKNTKNEKENLVARSGRVAHILLVARVLKKNHSRGLFQFQFFLSASIRICLDCDAPM